MYQSNLSFSLLKRYLDEVISSGLIFKREQEYFLTDSGLKFLDLFKNYKKNCQQVSLYIDKVENLKNILEDFLNNNERLPTLLK